MKVAALALLTTSVASAGFVHPGVLVSGDQLTAVRAAIANGASPQTEAFAAAKKSRYADPQWAIMGPPSNGTITCGSFSHPDIGCSAESDDGAAAYLQALLYQLSGEKAYAAKAIEILNSYSHVKAYTDSNAPLQASWGASKWTRAAELIIHSDASWAPEEQARFIKFLTSVTLPLVKNGSGSNGNWELSFMEATMGIAVLTEDEDLLQHAATIWRERVPAYYYLHTDGPQPIPPPRGAKNTNWNGQTVYNASVDGVCQETCRDLGHTQMGTAAAINGAETAYIQGIDLYGEMATRLTTALEFHANYLLGAAQPAYLCNGTALKGVSTAPTFEIAFRHFNQTLGYALPLTWKHITTQVRTESDEVETLMMIWETLSHGAPGPWGPQSSTYKAWLPRD